MRIDGGKTRLEVMVSKSLPPSSDVLLYSRHVALASSIVSLPVGVPGTLRARDLRRLKPKVKHKIRYFWSSGESHTVLYQPLEAIAAVLNGSGHE